MDLIIRNARLADRRGEEPLDIAVAGGKIVAIERSLAGASEIYDAGGRLACGGLIETHIHLDKSRIIDRCPPEDGREISPMKQVAALKPSLTEEDVRARAERTLVDCILNRAPPRRRAWLWLRPVERHRITLRHLLGMALQITKNLVLLDEVATLNEQGF